MSLLDWTKTLWDKKYALVFALISPFIFSCQDPTQAKNTTSRSTASLEDNGAYVYTANPIVLSGREGLKSLTWSDKLIPKFITSNFYLTKKCSFQEDSMNFVTVNNCLEVKNDRGVANSSLIQKVNNSWQFENDTDEFYQTNTFYHAKLVQEKFNKALEFARAQSHSYVNVRNPSSIPYRIGNNKNYWLSDSTNSEKTLQVFSRCYLESLNAFFDPSKNEVCLGWNNDEVANFRMAQDPSIIYHEMGHVFVKIMMNLRNQYTNGFTLERTPFQSNLGALAYDEAGAINEGIADYFAYFITARERVGEWGIGAHFDLDRPMSEENELHDGRIPNKLRYPEYLHYEAQTPDNAIEDIHNAGQIVSHYLVSLTKEFKNQCSSIRNLSEQKKHERASEYIMLLLTESLAEIGDMTGKSTDYLSQFTQFFSKGPLLFGKDMTKLFFTNLNNDESFLWGQQVTPPNFRRFFRTFAKNIRTHITENLCTDFDYDESERLLDDYGLLLFKSYKDTGRGIDLAHINDPLTEYSMVDQSSISFGSTFNANNASSVVHEGNRINSVLISKSLIDLPVGKATAFVVDSRGEMESFLNSLTFEGKPIQLSDGLASTVYNNGNVKISPGEIVAISLNLQNNSNSPMAGVQILANDWDHMQLANPAKNYVNRTENLATHAGDIAKWEPCQIDGWPLETEGGVAFTPQDAHNLQNPGKCNYTTRTNKILNEFSLSGPTPMPTYEADAPQPICTVQFSDENETKWVSQDEHRVSMGLSDNECLNSKSTGGGVSLDFNPNECLVRFVPGANQAVLGKLDPQKTWTETMAATTTNGQGNLLSSAFVVMEVNKWIQPGTTFNCRLRTRFSNCQDCYNKNNSGEDYLDFDYASEKPFKVINFSFTVID